jgi:RNA methyltransferase, TrmH family
VPSAPVSVSSRRHPAVRAFREAAAHPGSSSSVVLDGAHLVRDALAAGIPVRRLIVSSDFLRRAAEEDRAVVEAAAATGAAIYHATPAVLDAASPVRKASGLVALADWAAAPVDAAFAPAPALALALIDVQDPGNVGAVIRAADALGATGVLALDRTAHPGGWKALRGAMGSTFRLPVVRGHASEAIDAARGAGLRILATVAERAASIEQIDFTYPALVLLGNEGAGLPAELAAAADTRIVIPMRAGVNSLNVAVTAALVLYEARRQRSA